MSFPFKQADASLRPKVETRFPTVTWNSAVDHDAYGFFTINVSQLNGQPGPFWQEASHTFGTGRNRRQVDVVATQVMRCIPFGERRRAKMMFGQNEHKFVDFYAKREDYPGASRRIPIVEIMLAISGLEEPVILSLGNFNKYSNWDNVPGGRYGVERFPRGIRQQLEEYTNQMNDLHGISYRWIDGPWMVDFRPLVDSGGNFVVLEAGNGKEFTPFGLDTRVGGEGLPPDEYGGTRYCGPETFDVIQEWRREYAIPWEEEWANEETVGDAPEPFSDESEDYTDAEEPDFGRAPSAPPPAQAPFPTMQGPAGNGKARATHGGKRAPF